MRRSGLLTEDRGFEGSYAFAASKIRVLLVAAPSPKRLGAKACVGGGMLGSRSSAGAGAVVIAEVVRDRASLLGANCCVDANAKGNIRLVESLRPEVLGSPLPRMDHQV